MPGRHPPPILPPSPTAARPRGRDPIGSLVVGRCRKRLLFLPPLRGKGGSGRRTAGDNRHLTRQCPPDCRRRPPPYPAVIAGLPATTATLPGSDRRTAGDDC